MIVLRWCTGPSIIDQIDFRLDLPVIHKSIEIVVALPLPARLGGNLLLPLKRICVSIISDIDS